MWKVTALIYVKENSLISVKIKQNISLKKVIIYELLYKSLEWGWIENSFFYYYFCVFILR